MKESDFKSVTDQLLFDLEQGASAYHQKVYSVTMKEPNRKYRLSSAIQKCIRRGHDAEAGYFAQAVFHGGEGDYLWRRLPIVAFEDIGAADPGLCAMVVYFCRFKKVRDAIGARAGLTFLVESMARAVKSRTACDLLCGTYFTKEPWPSILSVTGHPLYSAVQAALAWGVPPTKEQAPAWWDGDQFVNPHPPEEQAVLREQALISLYSQSPIRAYLLHSGTKVSTSNLHAMLQPACQMALLGTEVVIRKMPAPTIVAGVPDFSFDQHTLEGKKALAYVIKSSSVLKEFQKNHEALTVDSLGMHLFHVESIQMDRQLVSKEVASLQTYVEALESQHVGQLNPGELRSILEGEQFKEDMLYARKRILGVV